MSTSDLSTRIMLETLKQSLASQQEPFHSDSKKARGAVALLLKEETNDLWLLMIRRHESSNDPWSGQMAFPGGHADSRDRTLFDTAVRETLEEVGIDIRGQSFLGCLRNIEPKNVPMVVAPFIHLVKGDVRPRTSPEAKEILWIPMSFLLNRGNITSINVLIDDREMQRGCYKYSNHVIWGMSFRIIRELISKITNKPKPRP